MFVRRSFSLVSISAASILFGLVPIGQSAAQDVRHICSGKYQDAKAAGTLNGETWPQFYSKCAAEAKANPPAAATAPAAAAPVDVRHICSGKYQDAKAAGTLNGEAWPQFYSRCVAETKANPPAATATPPATAVAPPPPPAPVVEAPPPPPPAPAPVVEAPTAAPGSGSRRCGASAASGQSAQETRDEANDAGRDGGAKHRRLSHRDCTGLCQ